MKNEKGYYYYPYPENKQTRMYVKKSQGIIWFRLWNQQIPELWDEHGWVSYDAIVEASKLYQKNKASFDPTRAYDINVAKEVLGENDN